METRTSGLLAGAAIGAGVGFLLDPWSGARRRSLVRQKALHAAHELVDGMDTASRDLAHRTRGKLFATKARLRADHPIDHVLAERVRSRLGRISTHPGAIEVSCRDGRVVLRGVVLRSELERVLAGVGKVRGVREVLQDFEIYDRPSGVPALQGGRPLARRGEEPPALRLLRAKLGVGMLSFALWKRNALGLAAGGLGLALLAGRTVGRRRMIEVHKTIHIAQPREQVYGFLAGFENFPRFMRHVIEARATSRGSHWRMAGPPGLSFEWDAVVTRQEPGRLVSWKSVAGAAVPNEGTAWIDDDGRGGTRLTVRVLYRPPGGLLGHALARIFRADPKKDLDDDLLRLKSLLERGRARGREGQVTLEQLTAEGFEERPLL